MLNEPLMVALTVIAGIAAGYFIRYTLGARRINSLENKLQEDERKSKNKAQDIILEAKNKAVELLDEAKEEAKERQASVDRLEERFIKKDEEFEKREEELRKEREKLEKQTGDLEGSKKEIEETRGRVEKALSDALGLRQRKQKRAF